MAKKPLDPAKLAALQGGAKMQETKQKTGPAFRQKNLKKVPAVFFEQHEALREQGKITGDFSSFIVEAIREKLERHQ
ncbi:hypothetical protein ACPV5S_15600 [Vibrio astriarenae]